MKSLLSAAALLAAFVFAQASPAQDLLPKAPPQRGTVVLRNATLHTVANGTVLNGTLWFEDGRIAGVAAADRASEAPNGPNVRVVDVGGRHVFPGLIAAKSSLGLVEIGAVRQSVDLDEIGDVSPEALAGIALNPDSAAIPVARSNGVLVAAVFPSGGLLPGRASVMQLDGWTNADMTVLADTGPVVEWPSRRSAVRGRRGRGGGDDDDDTHDRARQRIDDAFVAARAWLSARTADPSVPLDVRHAALAPAVRGEVPVFVLAEGLEQIESAVLWGAGRGLRVVIVGGREADRCTSLLLRHDVPVVVDGVHRLPRRPDSPHDESFTLPARLAAAGVRLCIATGEDFSNERNLPYHAATAAAHGLDPALALRAITLEPARVLGVGDRVGSLEVGKDATLFVADGHPFELTTRIEQAFVQGREIDLRNKQTELARKYRERYRQLRER